MHATSSVPASNCLWGIAIHRNPPRPTLAASVTCQSTPTYHLLICPESQHGVRTDHASTAPAMQQESTQVINKRRLQYIYIDMHHLYHCFYNSGDSQQHAKVGLLDGHGGTQVFCTPTNPLLLLHKLQ
jgi:hypothetical protein